MLNTDNNFYSDFFVYCIVSLYEKSETHLGFFPHKNSLSLFSFLLLHYNKVNSISSRVLSLLNNTIVLLHNVGLVHNNYRTKSNFVIPKKENDAFWQLLIPLNLIEEIACLSFQIHYLLLRKNPIQV